MTLRLAVVGVGHMGRFHAQKAKALEEEGIELVAVVDREIERARSVATEFGVAAFDDLSQASSGLDAVIVAVPTISHAEVVGEALHAGLDVLVEKPIAATLHEAEQLIAQARKAGRIVQVGHLEWFNAAMRKAAERIRRPLFIEAHRLGPFPDRATDVDVVRDLMIHDLDLIQRVVGDEPERIEAVGVPVITERVDIANARLTFRSGCVANVTASRVSPQPLRKIRFFQVDGYLSVDLLERELVLAERGAPDADGRREISLERVAIDRTDALEAQLRSFRDAVKSRSVGEGAADHGLAALRSALRVIEAMPALEPFT
ncbi:MAG: Gfo/Idh/MocA family oxidoreductase [Deltaproteobacteria bacterium]|nr:Gfo/Idh/MocA family oxidoreductase [Deltaproteobacteria bacterium]MBW2392966.1 Gfo/Idh/MocA family oxidoreductase [Deltaproteobacteria bacterium]